LGYEKERGNAKDVFRRVMLVYVNCSNVRCARISILITQSCLANLHMGERRSDRWSECTVTYIALVCIVCRALNRNNCRVSTAAATARRLGNELLMPMTD